METHKIDGIPEGFPLVIYDGKNYCEPHPQLKTVFNLRHSVFNKLEAIPKITHATRYNIKDLFSDEDIGILKAIYEDTRITSETKRFIKLIIDNNLVLHQNAPLSKSNEILSYPDLKIKYTQRTYTTFTKWVDLSGIAPDGKPMSTKRINTIINNNIYMPFPSSFNDRFDTQLHLNDQDLLKLGKNNPENLFLVKYLYLLTKYLLVVTSFSLNIPDSTSSNHMWGLYGSNGAGVVLTYSLDYIIGVVYNSIQNPDEFLLFSKVNYDDSHCPLTIFENCVDAYYIQKDPNALLKFFETFVLTKTSHWQYEKEFRFYRYSLGAYQHFVSQYGLNVTEKTCNELLKWAEDNKHKVEHEVTFIRPNTITLGWDCDTENEDIKNLITYARINSINVNKLDKYINYTNKKFYTIDINYT